MRKFLAFLYNPKEIEAIQDFTISSLTLEFLKFFVVVSLSFGLFYTVISKLIDIESFMREKEYSEQNLVYYFFKIVLFYPIIEELGFRLLLRVKRQFLAISLSIQIVFISVFLDILSINFYEFIFLVLAISSFLFLITKDWVLEKIRSNYLIFFLYNSLLFAVLHSYNYEFYSYIGYLVVVPYLLPPLIFGLYFSYVRISYGIVYAVSFHIFYNLVLFVPKIIES